MVGWPQARALWVTAVAPWPIVFCCSRDGYDHAGRERVKCSRLLTVCLFHVQAGLGYLLDTDISSDSNAPIIQTCINYSSKYMQLYVPTWIGNTDCYSSVSFLWSGCLSLSSLSSSLRIARLCVVQAWLILRMSLVCHSLTIVVTTQRSRECACMPHRNTQGTPVNPCCWFFTLFSPSAWLLPWSFYPSQSFICE